MNHHTFVSILAGIAIFALVVGLPSLWILFAVQSRGVPSPERYATLFLVAAFAGILLFVPAISIVATSALLGLGFAWLAGRYALTGLSYERSLSPPRLFPGDEGELTIRITNGKPLPLAWLTATDPIWLGFLRGRRKLPELLRFSSGVETLENMEQAIILRGAVGPFQTLTRTYHLTGLARGVYALGPARIESGDPFGIFRQETTMGDHDEIIVYPQVSTPDEIGLPLREAMGDLVTRRTLVEDPTLIAGSREYRPGDPLRRVHWKATARKGDLQVRISDSSTRAKLMIVLNLSTSEFAWQGLSVDRVEAAIRVAASLTVWALDQDFAVGLHSNGVIAGIHQDQGDPRISPSANPRQTTILLEHLARLSFSGRYSAQYLLLEEARRLREGTSIIFVTSIITPELISVLTSRQLAGRVSVVYCGRAIAPLVRGVPIYIAAPWETGRAVS